MENKTPTEIFLEHCKLTDPIKKENTSIEDYIIYDKENNTAYIYNKAFNIQGGSLILNDNEFESMVDAWIEEHPNVKIFDKRYE